jgi:hypothetical protein
MPPTPARSIRSRFPPVPFRTRTLGRGATVVNRRLKIGV